MIKFGLIEMLVDVSGLEGKSGTEVVKQGIRRDVAREAKVRRSAERAVGCGCDFIVVPGWSVVTTYPPSWLLDCSKGRIIVAEFLLPGSVNTTILQASEGPPVHSLPQWCDRVCYVLSDGRVLLGPTPQYIWTEKQLRGKRLSEKGRDLVLALKSDARRWIVPGIGEALLVDCGEANIVKSGKGGKGKCCIRATVKEAGLSEQDVLLPLIVNPSHTFSKLPAMLSKRAWLSTGGLLIHTANTHSGDWVRTDGKRPYSSDMAAAVWMLGEPQVLKQEPSDGRSGCTLKTFTWNP